MLGRISIVCTCIVLFGVHQDPSFQQLLPWERFGPFPFAGACAVAGLVYVVCVVYPLLCIAKNQLASNLHGGSHVSVRAELKRRGSWPQAYSRSIVERYETAATRPACNS